MSLRSEHITDLYSPSALKTGKRAFAKLAIFASLALVAGPLAAGAVPMASAATASPTFTLGSTSTVLGPTWHIDTPFNTLGRTPNVVGYISNTMAWGYTTSDLLGMTPLPGTVLAKGTSGNFDGCSTGGAWLNSTWTDPSNPSFIRGWYHAENGCDPAGNRKSVGYAESSDGGHTFTKPNYPNNQVLRAPSRFTSPTQGSEGDQHVIKVGSYFYMYFVAVWDNFKIHLARSLVSDGGRPGTWWKYYNGSFSQPGLGGESTAIASGSVLGRAWVSYNSALNAYLGFSWSTQGFGISMSSDGINWSQVSGTLLWTDHTFWGRGPGSGELIEYMSLIGQDGNPDVSRSDLWLYYMRIPAGQPATGDTRYLVRQALHVTPPGGSTPTSAPTWTPSRTAVPSNTPTNMPTSTPTTTATATPTGAPAYTASPTSTFTAVPTVPTASPTTNPPTGTVVATSTTAPTGVPTGTPTAVLTAVATATGTVTAGPTETFTRVPATATHASTPAETNTPARTATLTGSPAATATGTAQATANIQGTSTSTPTLESTATGFPEASVTPCGMNFSDVQPGDYFYTALQNLYCAGVVTGYADGTFHPSSHTTRGQIAKILVLAGGWAVDTSGGPHFEDVPITHTFYPYIETAYNLNIISGYACGNGCLKFRPNNDITRAQLTKVVVLSEGWAIETPSQATFQDVAVDDPFFGYVETAYAHSIVTGYTCGSGCLEFRPTNSATRAQICTILYNAMRTRR